MGIWGMRVGEVVGRMVLEEYVIVSWPASMQCPITPTCSFDDGEYVPVRLDLQILSFFLLLHETLFTLPEQLE